MQIIDNEESIISISDRVEISVTDYLCDNEDKRCSCGSEAYFKLNIFDKEIYLCNSCIGELAKCIIDGLV